MVGQSELFGTDEVDDFKSAKDRYGTWPVTVWECDMSSQMTRQLKKLVGDFGSARDTKGKLSYLSQKYTGADGEEVEVTQSIFNPAVASWILNLYGPTKGICFDPFAGGGTRAIFAAKHGLDYVGIELRKEEVDAVNERVKDAGVSDKVRIVHGDSIQAAKLVKPGIADFLMTCPPYFNLETYDGGAQDLSMADTYQDFMAGMQKVCEQTYKIMKPGSTSCWVIGLHRTPEGELLPMNHDLARALRMTGFQMREEIILSMKNNGAIQRVGNFEKGNKHLIRLHEYVLVFKKPGGK